MAIQADKNPPENRSYSERIVDFSGGLNTTISGSLLNNNESQKANDISLEQKGTIRPRRGRKKRYNAPFTTNPVTGLGVYYKTDGTSRVLISAGDSIYSDAPHMSTKWDSKADWEQDNVTLEGFLSVATTEGSITARKQDFGVAAKCEDATLWTALDATVSKKSYDSVYAFGSSLEVLIATGKTNGYAYKKPLTLDTTKYAVLTGYVKNSNAASGIRLVGLTLLNAVSKGSAYVTGTTWTRVTMKCAPIDLVNITSFGVNTTGVAGQLAYFTGLYYKYITAEEYNDINYVPPELTAYEAFNREGLFNSTSSFNTGSYSNTILLPYESVALDVELPAEAFVTTTQADFNAGTLTGVSTTETVNSVVLARQA